MRAWPAFSFPLALLAALALLSTWLRFAVELPDERNDGKRRHDPDYWIENMQVSRYDADGFLQHTFAAPRWVHYPDTDSATVTAPDLTLRSGPRATRARADEAHVQGSGDVVEFAGDVRIERTAAEQGSPPWQVTTTALTVVPDAETAYTRETVVFTQGPSRLQGTGLQLDNRARRLELHTNIHGAIVRRKAP